MADESKARTFSEVDLQAKRPSLKKSTTKEYSGPSEDDVKYIAELYDMEMAGRDPSVTAERFGVEAELVRANMPKNGLEFARNMYDGTYSLERDEAAKYLFRERLTAEITKAKKTLKRTETKENAGPSEEDIQFAMDIYSSYGGSLEAIAREQHLDENLLKQSPPKDARDFALKTFQGLYTKEQVLVARAEWRRLLGFNLQRASSRLKRTTTKENMGISPDEIGFVAKLYEDAGGNLEKLAVQLGTQADLLTNNPPKDKEDFAKKVLEGWYVQDKTAANISDFRLKLSNLIKDQAPNLKPAVVRKMTMVSDDELGDFAKFYTTRGGSVNAIATGLGISPKIIEAHPPADALDFAQKLCDGYYTMELTPDTKKELRTALKTEVGAITKGLRRTHTKSWDGNISADDINKWACLYTEHDGDMDKLAEQLGLSLDLLKETKLSDANEFARRLLKGDFRDDGSAPDVMK